MLAQDVLGRAAPLSTIMVNLSLLTLQFLDLNRPVTFYESTIHAAFLLGFPVDEKNCSPSSLRLWFLSAWPHSRTKRLICPQLKNVLLLFVQLLNCLLNLFGFLCVAGSTVLSLFYFCWINLCCSIRSPIFLHDDCWVIFTCRCLLEDYMNRKDDSTALFKLL